MFGEKRPVADNDVNSRNLFMEFIGTFCLTYFCAVSVMMVDLGKNNGVGNALVQFIVLSFLIYAGANISGSNFNGAVTCSLMISGHLSVRKGVLYWVFQFLGATLASAILFIYKASYNGPLHMANTLGYPHCDLKMFNVGACFLMETICTIFLIALVYKTAVNSTAPQNGQFGLCIGGTLGVACLAIGGVTGAGLNPWRVFPAAIFTGELFTGAYAYAWVYYVGYIVAPIVTGLTWRCVYQDHSEAQEEKKEEEQPINQPVEAGENNA